jgi:hypothetical protein
MADEIKKVEEPPKVPAPVVEGQKPAVEAKVEQGQPSGLDSFTVDQLKDFYKKSPQMFEEAGLAPKKEVKPEEKKEEKPKTEGTQSAAPVIYDGVEVNLPKDVPVDKVAIDTYLAHAKDVGLSQKQVQAQIDFQAKRARAVLAAEPKPKTPEELRAEADAANVAKLKSDATFGAKYEENMEIARRAAVKFGDPELLERLKTSDPVLVRHLWKLGQADAEDSTKHGPNRSGKETDDAQESEKTYLKQRFPNTPSMFKD